MKNIKFNEPFYFYHLVNKDADISKGLLSLQYMYDNKIYNLFDKYSEKYEERITNSWNIEKYKNKNSLTREEIIDALNIFRGKYGSKYIYFFRYPPFLELGPNMKKILEHKDIYRIDINNPEVKKIIKDIFYGYDMSNSDNDLLNLDYYKRVSKIDYFKKYDDNSKINYSALNHISIAFENDYCPIDYLQKMN